MSLLHCKGAECPLLNGIEESRKAWMTSLCSQYAIDLSLPESETSCGFRAWQEDAAAYQKGVSETAKLAGVTVIPTIIAKP